MITELLKFPDLQTALNELKTKGVNYVVDLTAVNSKIDQLKNELKDKPTSENSDGKGYIGIGLGVISVLILGYLAFFKNKQKNEGN